MSVVSYKGKGAWHRLSLGTLVVRACDSSLSVNFLPKLCECVNSLPYERMRASKPLTCISHKGAYRDQTDRFSFSLHGFSLSVECNTTFDTTKSISSSTTSLGAQKCKVVDVCASELKSGAPRSKKAQCD